MMHLSSSVGFAFITLASLGSAFAAPLSANRNGSADGVLAPLISAGKVQASTLQSPVPAAAATPGRTEREPTSAAAPPVVTVSQDPRPTLEAGTFVSTMRAVGTYKRIAEEGGWPTLPTGTVLKAGDKGPLVATLRQRLAREGDLPTELSTGNMFDVGVATAVKRFQARHGLSESGAVRTKTLEAINVSAEQRHWQR